MPMPADADRPLTLKELIHELSAGHTMTGEPVLVSGWDPAGNLAQFAVTGISVRTWHGRPVQTLELRAVDDEPAA